MARIKITQGKKRASGQHAAQGGRGRSQDTTRRGGACGERGTEGEGTGEKYHRSERADRDSEGERCAWRAGACPLAGTLPCRPHPTALPSPAQPRPPIRLARCPCPRPPSVPHLSPFPASPGSASTASRSVLPCPARRSPERAGQRETDRASQVKGKSTAH